MAICFLGLAYYNAGSAALVLVFIALAIGGFFWWRRFKSRRAGGMLNSPRAEGGFDESIPLTQNGDSHYADVDRSDGYDSREDLSRSRKGKERATEATPQETIFRVDDEESDEEGRR